MRMMAVAMLVFLFAIGAATIFESMYDIQTAKIWIYNALWFELLLVFLGLNLIYNIYRYQMFQRSKIAMLTFHLSFIVILIGAGITRYVSFEGLMVIREGQASNFIYTTDPHLWFKVNDGKMQYVYNEKKFMSEQANNYFDHTFDFPDHKTPITVEFVDFRKKQIDTLIINDSIKSGVLEIVTDGMKSNYLSPEGFVMVGEVALSFEKENAMPGIEVTEVGGQLMVQTKLPIKYLPMSEMQKARQSGADVPESMFTQIPTDTLVPFLPTTLYVVEGQQFVFKRKIPSAKMMKMSSGKRKVGTDILTLKISDGSASKLVHLEGGLGAIPSHEVFEFNGLTYEMEYGSTRIELPFSIICRDFTLDKYPGSEVASSFASQVTINDKRTNYKRDQRIFMNNVMDYDGYRFFQSSYDLDDPQTPENEEGTKLSVNHDALGTNITYIGYLLMTLGMILSLFAPVGRFKELLGRIDKSRVRRESALGVLLVASLAFSGQALAQEHDHKHDHAEHQHATAAADTVEIIHRVISAEHSDELASLLVLDFEGRIIPMHTMADQLLRKIYGASAYGDTNAVQTIMSMHMYPDYWMKQEIILVPMAVREQLHLDEYASYEKLAGPDGQFKWLKEYNISHQRLESRRSEFDKKLIKLVERFQVLQSIFGWQYMKIIPVKGAANNSWFVPLSMELMQKDSISSGIVLRYLDALHEGAGKNSFGLALDQLNTLKSLQREVAGELAPSESHVKLEISYNKMNVFKNVKNGYFTVGFLLLILFFARIFRESNPLREKRFRRTTIPFVVLIALLFAYHGAGLAMRWYISGHAPWSNGYEAIVFIAWVTMIAGFIFSRKNPAVLAATAILAFFMVFVSELNLMDPEITPLQPVLKSYWLMIHVAIITGSYGFLGLGAILSLLNMFIYVFRTKRNGSRVTSHINEITAISELTITIGLFMLTIGTFLGGIWANESWGRYWGWDPKETWALVSVLAYAVILHLRYIPACRGKFLFNAVSLWGYAFILFTFFGVNFYLVGLHSYAQGEGLGRIPPGIIIAVIAFILFTAIAAIRNKQYKNQIKADNDLI